MTTTAPVVKAVMADIVKTMTITVMVTMYAVTVIVKSAAITMIARYVTSVITTIACAIM
jgi:hypothetical protein